MCVRERENECLSCVQVTTTCLRIKEMGGSPGGVLYEFPLFRVSYCGTDKIQTDAFSVVAKDNDGL